MDAFMDRHGQIFALKHELRQAQNSRYSTVALSREIGTISTMNADESDRERRRDALAAFYEAHRAAGLKSVNHWAKASEVAERTLGQFLDGTRKKNMRADTYEKLARGATKLLRRDVQASDLMGAPSQGIERQFSDFIARLDDGEKLRALQILRAAFGAETHQRGGA
jgi:hypothetical protein